MITNEASTDLWVWELIKEAGIDKLIKVLENQLEEANKSRANLEKLLDQQQQLTLISNKKLENLKLELEEKNLEDDGINKQEKFKWYNFFRRKKN